MKDWKHLGWDPETVRYTGDLSCDEGIIKAMSNVVAEGFRRNNTKIICCRIKNVTIGITADADVRMLYDTYVRPNLGKAHEVFIDAYAPRPLPAHPNTAVAIAK
jgi:hypothetical protein